MYHSKYENLCAFHSKLLAYVLKKCKISGNKENFWYEWLSATLPKIYFKVL